MAYNEELANRIREYFVNQKHVEEKEQRLRVQRAVLALPDASRAVLVLREYEGMSYHEIADALDGIARRIRSGELVIDNLRGTPPEAAMAAALAILLKMQG